MVSLELFCLELGLFGLGWEWMGRLRLNLYYVLSGVLFWVGFGLNVMPLRSIGISLHSGVPVWGELPGSGFEWVLNAQAEFVFVNGGNDPGWALVHECPGGFVFASVWKRPGEVFSRECRPGGQSWMPRMSLFSLTVGIAQVGIVSRECPGWTIIYVIIKFCFVGMKTFVNVWIDWVLVCQKLLIANNPGWV